MSRVATLNLSWILLVFSIHVSIRSQAAEDPSDHVLIHYWNFNVPANLTLPTSTVGSGALSYTLAPTSDVLSGNGQSFAGQNARNADPAGDHLRFNNPIGSTLTFAIPTIGYEDIVVLYETRRSGSGAGIQKVSYTTNGVDYLFLTDIIPVDGTPKVVELDFTGVAGASNNSAFAVRFEFGQGVGGTEGNNRFDNLTVEGSALPTPELLHYWNFNNTSDLLMPTSTIGNGALSYTLAPTSVVLSGNGQGFVGQNARNGNPAGDHLRFNNPIGSTLTFAIPTTGYRDVVVLYETRRSGSGAGLQKVSYTVNGVDYTFLTDITPADGTPEVIELNFSHVTGVFNNSSFAVRFEFAAGGGGTEGNNRFDNLTVEGRAFSPPLELLHYWNFNNTSNLLAPASTIGDGALSYTLGSVSEILNGNGQGFSGANARGGDPAGDHLRVNDATGTSLTFSLPTTGYEKILVKYETRRSTNGTGLQKIYYSLNRVDFTFLQNVHPDNVMPEVITIDFSGTDDVSDNDLFTLRINLEQGTGGASGNNRFDNFTIEGRKKATDEYNVTLISPIANAVGVSLTPQLSWSPVADGSATYALQLAWDSDFSIILIDEAGLDETTFDVLSPLQNGSTYFWRVKTEHSGAGWSNQRRFTTIPHLPGQVSLVSPADEAADVSLKPVFQWLPEPLADTYVIDVSETEDYSDGVTTISGITSITWTYTSTLELATSYYWRVKAVNLGGEGLVSLSHKFTTVADIPALALRINEVMASNSSIPDDGGDFSDWIEIYNTGDNQVNLNGMGLTDSPTTPFKWIFPDITMAPDELIVVWASNKNRAIPGEPLHTNFAIGAEGENLQLTTVDGILVDLFPATAMGPGISYGRFPNGTGGWSRYETPTPGALNEEPLLPLVEQVTFSHPAGFYDIGFDLELTTSLGDATILYTLDGSDPDPGNLAGTTYQYKTGYSNPSLDELADRERRTFTYTGVIHIEDRSPEPNQLAMLPVTHYGAYVPNDPVRKATVVKARLWKEGYSLSPVAAGTYFIDQSEASQLPTFSLSIDEKLLFGYYDGIYVPGIDFDNWRDANPGVSYDGGSPANYWRDVEYSGYIEYFTSDTHIRNVAQRVGVKTAGNYTLAAPSKSLRIFARPEFGSTVLPEPFFPDLPFVAYERVTLRNSGNDFGTTMFRDAAIQESMKQLRFGTQAYRPSILFVNGEYWGILNIREHLAKYYLRDHYGVDEENVDLIEVLEVKEGDFSHYQSMLSYIEANGASSDDAYTYIRTQMDVDSFIDFQIAEIFAANTDWPGNNIMYWRARNVFDPNVGYRDGRWRWLMKDTDFGYGLGADYTHNTLEFATIAGGLSWPNPDWSTFLLRNLLDNTQFKSIFINRFADLLNTTFLPDRLRSIIDSLANNIENEMPHHRQRWGAPVNWSSNVDVMRDFVSHRAQSQREHIISKFQLVGKHVLTLNVNDPSIGHIHLNTIDINDATVGISTNPYPWSGTYFEGVPVTLRAMPAPGYRLLRWLGADLPLTEEVLVNLTSDLTITAVFTEDQIVRTAPYHGSHNVELLTGFSWLPVASAAGYVLQVSAQEDFVSLIAFESNLTGNTYDLSSPLEFNNTYYWRMRVIGDESSNPWSQVWSFVTTPGEPEIPLLISPVDDTGVSLTTSLSWSSSARATEYRVQLAFDDEFEELVTDQSGVLSSSYTVTGSLFPLTIYYWRVKASNSALTSNWSATGHFITLPDLPEPPLLLSPNDILNISLTPAFTWETSTYATSYNVQVSLDMEFENIEVEINDIMNVSVELTTPLAFQTQYFWRVRGVNVEGNGVWSAVGKFTTVPPVPEAPVLQLPMLNALNVSTTLELTWGAVAHAEHYIVEISVNADLSGALLSEQVAGTVYEITEALGYLTEYFWRVRAVNVTGQSGWSAIRKFTTVPPVPGVPTLQSPSLNAVNVPIVPELKWDAIAHAEHYIVEVSVNADLSGTFLSEEVTGTSYEIITALGYLTEYFWRVRAVNVTGESGWSTVRKFTTAPPVPSIPMLQSPSLNAVNVPIVPELKWGAAAHAAHYIVEISINADLSGVLLSEQVTGTVYEITEALGYLTEYFWRVRAVNVTGESGWSAIRKFTTDPPLPGAPVLQSPSLNAVNVPIVPELKWGAVAHAEHYIVEVSVNADFSGDLLYRHVTGTVYVITEPLAQMKEYFWRVRAVNLIGAGAWSSVWNFMTVVPPPAVTVAVDLNKATILVSPPVMSPLVVTSVIEVSASEDFANPLVIEGYEGQLEFILTQLDAGVRYYVRVKQVYETHNGEWSDVTHFVIYLHPPGLIAPADGETKVAILPKFQWQKHSTQSYLFQIDNDTGFKDPIVEQIVSGHPELQLVSALAYSATYYWRVKVLGAATESDWSPFSSFTTEAVTGLEEQLNGLRLYPNPVTNELHVDLATDQVKKIEVCDQVGRVLSGIDVPAYTRTVTFDFTFFSRGGYILRVTSKSGSVTFFRIMK